MAAYLKETGDVSILDEPVVYENRPGSEQPLYEHLQRCLRYTLERLGPHGLPLIGRADWNDCLNLNCFSDTPGESFQTTENRGEGTVAESVFIAGQFVLAAKEMAAIAEWLATGGQIAGTEPQPSGSAIHHSSLLAPHSVYSDLAANMETRRRTGQPGSLQRRVGRKVARSSESHWRVAHQAADVGRNLAARVRPDAGAP